MVRLVLNNLELVEIILKCERDIGDCLLEISSKHSELKPEDLKGLRKFLSKSFVPLFKKKWKKADGDREKFMEKYSEWLKDNKTVTLGDGGDQPETSSSTETPEEIDDAKEALKAGSSRFTAWNRVEPDPLQKGKRPFTPEEALALQFDIGMPNRRFQILRSHMSKYPLLPPHELMSQLKKQCLPANIEFGERCCRVSAQDLFDHSVQRILFSMSESSALQMTPELMLTTRWDCEGTRFHRAAKRDSFSKGGLFVSATAPLKLENSAGEVYFANTKRSLWKSCRPLKLEFVEISQDLIKAERERIQKEVDQLKPTDVEIYGKKFTVNHRVLLATKEKKLKFRTVPRQIYFHEKKKAREEAARLKPSEIEVMGKKITVRPQIVFSSDEEEEEMKPKSREQERAAARMPLEDTPLPLRDVCEEAVKTGDEIYKNNQEDKRPDSREAALRSMFKILLAESDPYIIAFRVETKSESQ